VNKILFDIERNFYKNYNSVINDEYECDKKKTTSVIIFTRNTDKRKCDIRIATSNEYFSNFH